MPDYITDPGLLSQLSGTPPASKNPAEFAQMYGAAAERAGAALKVEPKALLAQWGLETGWGKSVIPGTNNLGNIKDMAGSGVAAVDNQTGSRDKYRSFDSPEAFADHYAGLVGRKYKGAIGAGSDIGKFASGLNGYAEDPRYAEKLQAAYRTIGSATNPVLQVANKVTSAIMPTANAAESKQYIQDPELLATLNGNQGAGKQPATEGRQYINDPALLGELEGKTEPITRTDKFFKGLRDPIDAGAQLLTNVLPKGVVATGNKVNNWLADKTGLMGRLPEGGVDQQVREGEQAYQKSRQAAGESGFDGYRVAGNIVNPANLTAAAKFPQAASLLGRVGVGAGFGAATGGAFTPVAEGDFTTEKLKQIGIGAAGGGVAPVVTNALSRMISPVASTNPLLRTLREEGVSPTVGQTLGGRWNALEEKMQSIPILGDAIAGARGRSLREFNNAAINRASGAVGSRTEGVGQGAVANAGNAISASYDDALSRVRAVPLDPQFSTNLTQLHGMAQNLAPALRDRFNTALNDVVMRRVSPQGSILGSSYKDIDSELGNLASRYGKSAIASEQEFGDAVAQLQNLLRQQMMRTNPQVAAQLRAADEGWANLVRVEGAAKSAKNAEGVFTPAQLNGAIQAADDSVRKRAVSRGNALMQDLGNAGQAVLGNKVPNSFTADRAMIAGGALGSYFVNPAIPAGLLAGASMYSRPVQNALTALVSARPQSAQPVANALNQYSTALLPLGTQIGLGFDK